MFKKLITYFFVFFVLLSCKKENEFDCFKPNGTESTESRPVAPFKQVKVFDKIDLNISPGTEFKVVVMAGKHLLSNISTDVSDNTLNIKNNNKCNFVRGYKSKITVNVTVPYLQKLEHDGVGTVTFDQAFDQDTLFVRAENSGDIYVKGTYKQLTTSSHGNGDIYVSGICDRLFVYTFGTNYFRGEQLTVNSYAFLETISVGECYLNAPASGTLQCNIHRSGNIYYTGNPTEVTDWSDGKETGKLIKQ